VRPQDFRSGKTSFTDLAYKYVLDGILSFEFKPGDSLRVRDLAPVLGISTTPVERALERLAGEGLVEFRAGLGPFVAKPTVQEVIDLYDARLMFQLHAVEQGIDRVDVAYLRRLKDLVEEHASILGALRDSYEYRMHSALNEADRDVHEHIISVWPNAKIRAWYMHANAHIKSFQLVGGAWFFRQNSADEHRAICSGLEGRNLAATRRAIQEHENASRAAFIRRVQVAGGSSPAVASAAS
jgi:DNA-binding GntR family transcriptional regulator